jgi:Transglycosylase SLT domain
MAAPARLPEGVTQPTVDPLTLEALIEMYGNPNLRDQYFRHFGNESAAGTADIREATKGASGLRGGRGPLQVTERTFGGLRDQGYVPQNYRWDNPLHSTQAGLALFSELSKRFKTNDQDTLSALYYAGDAAVKRGKDGKLTINREYTPVNNWETVGEYLDKMQRQQVPSRFSPEQVEERRRQVEAYLPHSYSTPYDYSLVDKVGADQAARPAKSSGYDDKSFYSTAVEKIKAARAAGNAEIERRVRELVDQYAIMRGHKKKEQEENGD